VLREVKNAGFVPQGIWFWKRYVFHAGKHRAAAGLKFAVLAEARALQQKQAVPVLRGDGR
jgi:5-methylcytosine-specific restriction endonuclease McrA